jgi:hypothetical protein
MPLNNCICGKQVRLRATKIRFNRKHGVSNYIEHDDGTNCERTKPYICSMMKPYPKNAADYPCEKMIEKWNAENPDTKEAILTDAQAGYATSLDVADVAIRTLNLQPSRNS